MAKKLRVLQDIAVIDIGEKGSCIGKSKDGEIVLVSEKAVPGDVVDIQWRRKKKGLKLGYPLRWKTTSEHRIDPFCRHFQDCGGCSWQHMRYDAQLLYKEKKVKDVLARIAKDDIQKVRNIVPCDQTFGYRNKMEYTFSRHRWLTDDEIASGEEIYDREALGFHVSGSFEKVLNIEECLLQNEKGNCIRNYIRQLTIRRGLTYYDVTLHAGFLRNLIIRNSTLDEWMVVLVFGENRPGEIMSILREAQKEFPEITSWHYVVNTKRNSSITDLEVHHFSGRYHIFEKLGRFTYQISPQSFFQTNSLQAEKLYNEVHRLANAGPEDVVYDLYCGTGSIGIFLSGSSSKVVGIESVSKAIDDAKMNATLNEVNNIHFVCGDVKDVLSPEFQKRYGSPSIVVTDPPRAGMHQDVVNALLKLQPLKIIYVSCNPSTQARDIALLKERYILKEVTPVDMFPHTSHIESVALLHIR